MLASSSEVQGKRETEIFRILCALYLRASFDVLTCIHAMSWKLISVVENLELRLC